MSTRRRDIVWWSERFNIVGLAAIAVFLVLWGSSDRPISGTPEPAATSTAPRSSIPPACENPTVQNALPLLCFGDVPPGDQLT